MHNSFILQQYVCYTTILNMFRAARCSSSGGQTLSLQPLVSSPSVNSRTVCRWRADWVRCHEFSFWFRSFNFRNHPQILGDPTKYSRYKKLHDI